MGTVLVIEDDAANRQALRHALEDAGYAVQEAADGRQGLANAEERRPDLIILDIMLPGMNGWEVCRKLKSNPSTCQIPIVILTGFNQQSCELRGWENGVDEFLIKPWSVDQLLGMASRFLSHGQAA